MRFPALKMLRGILRGGGVSLMLSAVLGLSLTGCGTSSDFVLPHRNMLQPDIHFVPYDQVKSGGSLKLPLDDFPPNFNYNENDGNTGDVLDLLHPTDFSPFITHYDGTMEINRNFFTNIQEKIVHGKQTLIYTINPQAHWSTGVPITEHDFAVQAYALSGKNPQYIAASNTGYNQIDSVMPGKNDRQVIVTMRKPLGEWKGTLFSPMYPASVQDTPDKFNTALVGHVPPTAGPFTYDYIDPIRKIVVLKRDPHWWGRPAKLDSLRFTVIASAAGVEPYLTREMDVLGLGGDVNDIQRALHAPHTVIRISLSTANTQLTFNCAFGRITHDIHIRQAIAKAIDRSLLSYAENRVVFGKEAPVLNNHIYLEGERGYQDNSAGFHYDPGAARKELADDGWKLGRDGVRHKDGKSLYIVYLDTVGQDDEDIAFDEIIQAELKAVGIKMSIMTVPISDYFNIYIDQGDFDISSFMWQSDVTQPVTGNEAVFYYDPHCDRTSAQYKPSACSMLSNSGLQGNEEINKKYDQAVEISNDTQRIQAANAVDRLLWQNMGELPILQTPIVDAMDSRIVNYGPHEIGDTDWTAVGWIK